jgi:hypothetical protein
MRQLAAHILETKRGASHQDFVSACSIGRDAGISECVTVVVGPPSRRRWRGANIGRQAFRSLVTKRHRDGDDYHHPASDCAQHSHECGQLRHHAVYPCRSPNLACSRAILPSRPISAIG